MTTTYKTYKWFNPRPCTITEGTAMYRDLASKHHPDHGGSVSDMQEINAEWDELPSYPATVARFEYFTANSAAFRRSRFRLEELQGDHIISDREAAAFVLAAEQCGII